MRTNISGPHTAVYNDVYKGNVREKTKALDFLVITRWQAVYKETVIAKQNQNDLDTALQRTICLSGIDEALFEANEKYIDAIFPNDHDWMVYAQYAVVMFPTSLYFERSQS